MSSKKILAAVLVAVVTGGAFGALALLAFYR